MNTKIDIFCALGGRLRSFGNDALTRRILADAMASNAWFSEHDIISSARAIADDMLCRRALEAWLSHYDTSHSDKNIGIIMAGNIPFVGFFDLLCVIMAGCAATVKPSSKDSVLINYIIGELLNIDPSLKVTIAASVESCDAVIATGSDSTNMHFKTKYAHIPSLLRSTRYSVAVLNGNEGNIVPLGEDIFPYNTMGCRSVSLLFVPHHYDLTSLAASLGKYRNIVSSKVLSSYAQQRAVAKLKGEEIIDGGFFIFTESTSPSNALGSIAYCRYDSRRQLEEAIEQIEPKLQCLVSDFYDHPRRVAIGAAQHPTLTDYADGVDTMKWIEKLKQQ